jgi:delta 1-pyrroline-5-carboxylate dehydrogenase
LDRQDRPGARRDGPVQTPKVVGIALEQDGLDGASRDLYTAIGLVDEVSTAINTAAAGGNASLMSVG